VVRKTSFNADSSESIAVLSALLALGKSARFIEAMAAFTFAG
jgi:hypothetical protein